MKRLFRCRSSEARRSKCWDIHLSPPLAGRGRVRGWVSSRTAETVRLRTLEPVRPITQAPHPTSPREGAGRGEGAHFLPTRTTSLAGLGSVASLPFDRATMGLL